MGLFTGPEDMQIREINGKMRGCLNKKEKEYTNLIYLSIFSTPPG